MSPGIKMISITIKSTSNALPRVTTLCVCNEKIERFSILLNNANATHKNTKAKINSSPNVVKKELIKEGDVSL